VRSRELEGPLGETLREKRVLKKDESFEIGLRIFLNFEKGLEIDENFEIGFKNGWTVETLG